MGALSIIGTLITMLPDAVQFTTQVLAIKNSVQDLAATGREPTAEEWDALNAHLADLKAQLDKDP